VHIPKTAGGTVSSMFRAAYTKRGLHKAGNYMRGPEKTRRKIAKDPDGWRKWQSRGGHVSIGHVPYVVFRDAVPPGTLYMTFMREPVDRVLSHYYRHIHRIDPSRSGVVKKHARARIKADSLEQALVEMNMPQLNNLCTRFLCSQEDVLGRLPDVAVEEAKENLSRFAFIGIQERFEESLVLLQRMLGLAYIPYEDRHVSRPGQRPGADDISAEQRALIVDHNRLDIELYRHALALFEEAVAEAGESFIADVEALRARDSSSRTDEWRQTIEREKAGQ